jgi:hypothetical protein
MASKTKGRSFVSIRNEHQGFFSSLLDVRLALIELVKLGWAKAYRLSPGDPIEEVRGAPSEEQVDNYYYWITDMGRAAQGSFEGWPFDEVGVILPDWRPPGLREADDPDGFSLAITELRKLGLAPLMPVSSGPGTAR